jgi:hypothetical protein
MVLPSDGYWRPEISDCFDIIVGLLMEAILEATATDRTGPSMVRCRNLLFKHHHTILTGISKLQ